MPGSQTKRLGGCGGVGVMGGPALVLPPEGNPWGWRSSGGRGSFSPGKVGWALSPPSPPPGGPPRDVSHPTAGGTASEGGDFAPTHPPPTHETPPRTAGTRQALAGEVRAGRAGGQGPPQTPRPVGRGSRPACPPHPRTPERPPPGLRVAVEGQSRPPRQGFGPARPLG